MDDGDFLRELEVLHLRAFFRFIHNKHYGV
jgi:hypothetical protein